MKQVDRALAMEFRTSIRGYGEVEFAGIAPSGNVMARKPGDKQRGFGPFTLDNRGGTEMRAKIAAAYARQA
jgi:hypothetical protein